jgi:hypothetical protein
MLPRTATLFTVAMVVVASSGCLGIDLMPPEHERDDPGYVVHVDGFDPSLDGSDPVYDFESLNESEQEILRVAIRDGQYEECTVGGVTKAARNLVKKFRDGSAVLDYEGKKYSIVAGVYTHQC